MGIPRPVARLLFEEGRRRPFGGSVLQVGRCYVYLRWDELEGWAARDGFALRKEVPRELSHDPHLASEGCISDRTFFLALGFDEVLSLDLLDDEKPTYLQDMNLPVPAELEGRFDVVFDTGTLVHVFDQKTAFCNIARLVKPGGRAIHGTSPSSNHVDMGFFMFSPTLHADFYAANRWQVDSLQLCEFEPLWLRGLFVPPVWKVRPYAPGDLDAHRLGGLNGSAFSVWAVATKVAGAAADRSPIQHCFRVPQAGSPGPASGTARANPSPVWPGAPSLGSRAGRAAYALFKRMARRLRPAGRGLRPVSGRL
jgi:SAM-dependent methyltransferase